jgi:tetratricopeptide (TPR) repeat protein
MKALEVLRKVRLYLIIVGGICLCFGIYQKHWYSDLVQIGAKSIEANRLDEQSLEEAKKGLFSSDGVVVYNMGVRAYRADNLRKASVYFYEVIRNSHDSFHKKLAYYNLGNILVKLELPAKAAEMYRESLRLDPTDWESKYNLERLYVFYPKTFSDENNKASLEQEPRKEKDDKSQRGQTGLEPPDI